MQFALLVPGQGNQHPNMFKLLRNDPAARDVLAHAREIFGDEPHQLLAERKREDIYRNRFAQPLICTGVMATWQALTTRLPRPDLVLGYSVGELAAYGVAGALSVEETLRLACRRASLMDAAAAVQSDGSSLLAIRGLNTSRIETLCNEYEVEIAAINGRSHFVLGGPNTNLLGVRAAAAAQGATLVRQLDVALASHTSLLHAAGVAFRNELNAARLRDPVTPLLAGVDARLVTTRAVGIDALASQLYRPLAWSACLDGAIARGCRVFLELGPGYALTRMMRESHPHIAVRSVEEFTSLGEAADWAARALERPAVEALSTGVSLH